MNSTSLCSRFTTAIRLFFVFLHTDAHKGLSGLASFRLHKHQPHPFSSTGRHTRVTSMQGQSYSVLAPAVLQSSIRSTVVSPSFSHNRFPKKNPPNSVSLLLGRMRCFILGWGWLLAGQLSKSLTKLISRGEDRAKIVGDIPVLGETRIVNKTAVPLNLIQSSCKTEARRASGLPPIQRSLRLEPMKEAI